MVNKHLALVTSMVGDTDRRYLQETRHFQPYKKTKAHNSVMKER